MNRKEFLKSLGFITAGATFLGTGETVKAAGKAIGLGSESPASTDAELDFPVKGLKANVKNGPVKVIIMAPETVAALMPSMPRCSLNVCRL